MNQKKTQIYCVFNVVQDLTVTIKPHKEKRCAKKACQKHIHFIKVHLQFIFYNYDTKESTESRRIPSEIQISNSKKNYKQYTQFRKKKLIE